MYDTYCTRHPGDLTSLLLSVLSGGGGRLLDGDFRSDDLGSDELGSADLGSRSSFTFSIGSTTRDVGMHLGLGGLGYRRRCCIPGNHLLGRCTRSSVISLQDFLFPIAGSGIIFFGIRVV